MTGAPAAGSSAGPGGPRHALCPHVIREGGVSCWLGLGSAAPEQLTTEYKASPFLEVTRTWAWGLVKCRAGLGTAPLPPCHPFCAPAALDGCGGAAPLETGAGGVTGRAVSLCPRRHCPSRDLECGEAKLTFPGRCGQGDRLRPPHAPACCTVRLGQENKGRPGTRPQTRNVEAGLGPMSKAAGKVARE